MQLKGIDEVYKTEKRVTVFNWVYFQILDTIGQLLKHEIYLTAAVLDMYLCLA